AVTRWAWTAVMAPVLTLTTETELVLVPSGLLAMLPLHASWTTAATGRRYLLDERTMRYAPNGRALRYAARGMVEVANAPILGVADPHPPSCAPSATPARRQHGHDAGSTTGSSCRALQPTAVRSLNPCSVPRCTTLSATAPRIPTGRWTARSS